MALNRVHIRYKGVFNTDELIKAITDWFEKKGYEYYIYQTKSKESDFGTDYEYGIKGWVNETEYHRLLVDVYIKIYDAVAVEVTENGEKKEMTKAAMYIKVDGDLQTDFAERFEHSGFAKKLKSFMENYIINERYGAIWMDDHFYRIEGLGDYIKEFLNCNTVGKYF